MIEDKKTKLWPRTVAALALAMPAAGFAASPTWIAAADLYPDDSAMSSEIAAKLASDEQTRTMDIEVRSHDGVVQLNGVVDSEARAERAAELAHEVAGVWRVQNVLSVRATTSAAPASCLPGQPTAARDATVND